jgi:hypothetical protein
MFLLYNFLNLSLPQVLQSDFLIFGNFLSYDFRIVSRTRSFHQSSHVATGRPVLRVIIMIVTAARDPGPGNGNSI